MGKNSKLNRLTLIGTGLALATGALVSKLYFAEDKTPANPPKQQKLKFVGYFFQGELHGDATDHATAMAVLDRLAIPRVGLEGIAQ